MIVSLLISAVCIETKDAVKDKAGVERNGFLKEESIDNHEDFLVQKRQSSKHNRYSNDQDPRSRRCSGSAERRTRAGVKDLANKMAKDALKSPKMQETMNKLSRVASKPHGTLIATVKVPVPKKPGVKKTREQKHGRHKGRKSKSKRHHRRYKNGHGWKGSSKRTSDSGRDINSLTKDLSRKEKSLIKCNQAVPDKSPATPKSNVKITHIEDSDYIDFSSPVNTEPLTSKLPENESPVKLRDDERMIDKLMRTTTRDPLKKSPGDQGIEYSDYYSDTDVLEDLAANKIPMQIAHSRNSNDRFARETADLTSHRRVDRHVPPQHRNHVARRKNFKYPNKAAKRSFHPTRRFVGSNRNSRFLRRDDSRSKDDQYEHLDPMYSVNNDESQPKQEDLDVLQNEDTSDDDKLNIEQQNPEQFNYLTQYEEPQEDSGSMNEAAVPDSQMNQMSMEFPQDESSLPERFDSSENMENYQPEDTSLQRVENFDQNFGNQPRIENVGPSMENINGYEVQSQPSYPVQSYDNLETPDVGKDVSVQNNLPQPYSSNAMDQPLGKILKSLGINIDADSGDKSQNANLENGNSEKKVPVYPNSLERPEEHALSYLKQGAKAEINRNEMVERNQAMQSRNGVGHSRRHSLQNDNQFLPYTDNPAHHMNISIAVQDTKEIATQILDTIMEELEELKLDRSKNNKREGLPCRLSGSWSTAQAGVKLDMRVANRSIIVTVSELATPRFHESLLNGTWNVSGHAPFKRGSPFTLIATDNNTKSIAVFVGACRVCQGVDTIAGVWSVARQPKDCRDFQVATSVFNDIFRKTKLSSLRENHNSTGSESGALNHEKRKS